VPLEGGDVAPSSAAVEYLAAHPDVIVEQYARESGLTPQAVVHALPPAMRRFTDGARFVDVMTDVARWGDVTLIVHTDDGIMEFGGAIPAGQISRGYYNVPGTSGFHGHLRHERCSEIAFVERPFMGRNSASILFFNTDGNIMFKIFVGRDADRNLKSDQLEMFRSLASGASQ
jgi:putative heme utilization carrier protein HutX